MFKTKKKAVSELDINGTAIPVNILVERRSNARVSIGKRGVNMRLPWLMSSSDQKQQVANFTQWALNTFAQRPELLARFQAKTQSLDGHQFTLQGTTYTVDVTEHDKASSSSKLKNDIIYIKQGLDAKPDTVAQLISRAIAKKYYHQMHSQLLYLNKLYFNKTVVNFRLKYTSSVWGSCSRKGNINISTRLLFAPADTIDYVLIHELAHLVQPNHSQAFWDEVARCMPDYKEHTKWLKRHGKHCDFYP